MRRITRRLTVAVLSACLALSPLGALAEPMMTAQVELPLNNGSLMLLPVQTVITSTGETVYWLDMSLLDDGQILEDGTPEQVFSNPQQHLRLLPRMLS